MAELKFKEYLDLQRKGSIFIDQEQNSFAIAYQHNTKRGDFLVEFSDSGDNLFEIKECTFFRNFGTFTVNRNEWEKIRNLDRKSVV